MRFFGGYAASSPRGNTVGAVDIRLRRARTAVSTYFAVMGLASGVWLARIPAIKTQAHLSDGTLGAALFALPVGLFLGSFAAERLIDRVGSAPAGRVCGIGIGPTITAPGAARNLAELVAALLAYGRAAACSSLAKRAGCPGRGRLRAAGDDLDARRLQPRRDPGALIGGGFAWAGWARCRLAAAGAGRRGRRGVAAGAGCCPEGTPPPRRRRRGWLPRRRRAHRPGGPQAAAAPARRDSRHVRRLIIALGVLAICRPGEGGRGRATGARST